MANSKYIRASDGNGEAVRANVVEDRGIGNMALNVDSVLNFPHDFIASTGTLGDDDRLIFDSVTVFYGHLDGSIMMIDSFAPGYSDKGNVENQVVLIKPTTAWADELSDILDDISASVILSDTAPADPFAGMLWYDTDDPSTPILGNVSVVDKEVPTGTKDGTNITFTTSQPYVPGSLQVYVNGVNQGLMATETVPTTGTFTIDAPLSTDDLSVSYRFSGNTNTNSADVVDNLHANATPTANTLLPLNAQGKFTTGQIKLSTINWVDPTGTNFGTASTTFVDITGVTTTYTSGAYPEFVMVWFQGMFIAGANPSHVGFMINGVDQPDEAGYSNSSTIWTRFCKMYAFTIPANTTYTLKGRIRSEAAVTTTFHRGSAYQSSIRGFAISQ